MIAVSALRPRSPAASRVVERQIGDTIVWPGPKDNAPDRAAACQLYSHFVPVVSSFDPSVSSFEPFASFDPPENSPVQLAASTGTITTDGSRTSLPDGSSGTYLVAPSVSPQPGCVVTVANATSALWESCSLIWQPPPHAALLWTSGGMAAGSGGVIGTPKWPPQAFQAAGEIDASADISARLSIRPAVAATVLGSATIPARLLLRALSGSTVPGAGSAKSDFVVSSPSGTLWFATGETDGAGSFLGRAMQRAAVASMLLASAGISGNATVLSAFNPQQYTEMGIVNGAAGISGSAWIGHQYFVAGRPAAATAITFLPVTALRVTNYVRNPRPEMNAGSTNLPAEWFSYDNSGEASTMAVIGTGTESQIPHIDFQFAGTGSVGGYTFFQTETAVFTSAGTTWSYSQFLRLVGGSLANISQVALIMFTADSNTGAGIAPHIGASITPTGAGLVTQNFAYNGQNLNDAGMDSFGCGLYIVHGVGAFNLTLRIGGPKAEKAAASSPGSCIVVPKVGLVPGFFGSTSFVY